MKHQLVSVQKKNLFTKKSEQQRSVADEGPYVPCSPLVAGQEYHNLFQDSETEHESTADETVYYRTSSSEENKANDNLIIMKFQTPN